MAKIYGYARVSTRGQEKDGNSLEHQEKLLRDNGATEIFKDAYTGTKLQRPEFDKLLNLLKDGDTLIVTKLDRFARSMIQGSELVTELINKGVRVNILNIGVMDNTAASKLVRNIFFSFAEFERDMIVERTREGKEIAKQRCKENGEKFIEGRPVKFTKKQLDNAMKMLEENTYKEVEEITGISRATLVREKAKRKAEELK